MVLAVAMRASDVVRIIAKWLFDPLFQSTSDGGLLFLLGGVAAISSVLALTAARAPDGLPPWIDRPDPGFALLSLVAFGHGLGLLALLEYQETLDLPWQLNAWHWSGPLNTFNTLLHSHVGKTALSTVLQALGGSGSSGPYDTGSMLVAHVAAAERWTLAALFTVACLAALAAAPSIARRHAWHPVAIALYVYAAMNCLKTIIDGGMLTCQLLPSLLMLALLAAATDGNHLVALARRYFPAAVLALIACAGGWAMVSDEGWGGAATGFIPVLIPLALGLLCWAFRAQTRTGLRRLALAIGIGWLALGYLQEAVLGIGMLLRPLPPQARVVVIDPVALVARDASVAVLGATPLSIYRRFGDDPLKPSRVLIQTGVRAADIPGRELTFAVRFIDGGQRRHRGGDGPAGSARSPDRAEDAAHVQSSLYSLLGANRAPDRVNTAVFLFRTASPDIPPFFVAEADHLGRNNFQVHLHLIAATLRTQGLAEFVMMPLLRASDRGLFLPGR